MRIGERYEVVKELGRGAFGVVYEAHDEVLDRPVALKAIREEALSSAGSREVFEKRFWREARAAAKLTHPNIVSVFDTGTHESLPFIVMEFVPGRTLRAVLEEQGRLPIPETLSLAEQLLSALQYAHTAGIVHRDIKPENLMLRPDGILKVTDFGIARVIQNEAGTLTREGGMGTPSYMAPEQILSKPVDGRADVFASSAVVYEMLGGQRAFTAESLPAILYKILCESPAPLPDEVPKEIREIVLKGLAKKPEARYPSCQELLAALLGRELPPQGGVHHGPDTEILARVKELHLAPELAEMLGTAPAPASPGRSRETAKSFPTLQLWVPPAIPRAPDLAGSLAEVPVPELLLGLRKDRESGTLIVESPEWALGLELSGGAPCGAWGGPPGTAMGPMLKKAGHLDTAAYSRLHTEFKRSVAVDGSKRSKFGSVAVRMGLLSPQKLLELVEQQIDVRVDALLSLTKGSYRFYRGFDSGEWTGMSPRPIEELIAKGLRSRPSRLADLAEALLRRAGGREARLSPEAMDMLPLFHFGAPIQRLLRAVPGRPLREALASEVAMRSEAELALYLLWAIGALSLGPEPTQAMRITATLPRIAPPPAATPPPERPSRSIPRVEHLPRVVRDAPPNHSEAARREAVDKLAQATASMQARNFSRAIPLLQTAKSLDPANVEVLVALGHATFRSQPGLEAIRKEAKAHLQAALKLEPHCVAALVALGRILRIEDDLKGARSYIERALAIDPESLDVRIERDGLERLENLRGSS